MIGGSILASSTLLLLLIVTFSEPSLYTVAGLIFLVAGAIPMSGPIASSVFMQLYDKNAGTASASMGISRVVFGMIGGFLVTVMHNDTLYPMVAIMFVTALGAMVCFITAGRRLAKLEKL